MWIYALLFAGGFLAAAISGAAGFGGALLLLPVLTWAVGVDTAVPLLTVGSLVGNASRVALGFTKIRWRAVGAFLLGALPMSAAGALSFASLPASLVVRLVGAALLLFVGFQVFGDAHLEAGTGLLVGGGAAVGFLSGLVGSAGPLGAAIFLSLKLPPVAYVASEATTAVAMHAAKSVIYQRALGFEARFWALAAALSVAMIAGTWVGKRLIEGVPVERFQRAVRVLLVLVALQMLIMG